MISSIIKEIKQNKKQLMAQIQLQKEFENELQKK
jgi:hypothetical protein